jgi:hypothetical protein
MKLEHCHRASCVQSIDALSDSVSRATNNALYWHNRCLALEEIIEMFCMDAAEQQRIWAPPATIVLTEPKPDPTRGWIVT